MYRILSSLFGRTTETTQSQTTSRSSRYRPWLETLEERHAPSMVPGLPGGMVNVSSPTMPRQPDVLSYDAFTNDGPMPQATVSGPGADAVYATYAQMLSW